MNNKVIRQIPRSDCFKCVEFNKDNLLCLPSIQAACGDNLELPSAQQNHATVSLRL